MSNFDKNFEKFKTDFKKKFGMNWDEDKHLFMLFAQSAYASTITEILFDGLNKTISRQDEMMRLIEGLNAQLQKK